MTCKEPVINTPSGSPYANDLFGLSPFGDFLKGIVDSYTNSGAVIALNGEWGVGKTTFLNMWNQSLKDKEYRTLFFNAWQCDFHDDPMIALMGELADTFSHKDGVTDLISKAARLTVALGKDILKGVVEKHTGVKLDSLIDDASAMAVDAVRNYHQNKNLLSEFKTQLSEFVADPNNDKPVIFIIDELDRCNPLFAVKLLERLKHVFEVPNIVFVLGLNIDQLQFAIQGFYGSASIDGKEYLKRFFDLELNMPTPKLNAFCDSLFEAQGINAIFNKHTSAGWVQGREKEKELFTEVARDLFVALNINPRKVFRIIHYTRIVLGNCKHNKAIDSDLVFLLCFLKVIFPLTFDNIKNYRYSIQELLAEMENIFPYTLLVNSEYYGPQRRTVWLIGKLIVSYNYADSSSQMFDKTFVPSVNEESNKHVYPLSPKIISEEDLFQAIKWEEDHYRERYDFSLRTMLSRVALTENLS